MSRGPRGEKRPADMMGAALRGSPDLAVKLPEYAAANSR